MAYISNSDPLNISNFILIPGIRGLHSVRGKFPDNVLGAAVGPIFIGH